MTPGELIGIWIATGLTLMMFSFIYRDNAFFKFGEHLYLGLSVANYLNVMYWTVIQPEVVRRMTVDNNYTVLIPTLLGIFILLRMVPKLAWLSRWAFAFYIGGYAGLAIPNLIHGIFLPQLSRTLKPFGSPFWVVLLAMVLIFGFFWALAKTMEQKDLKWGAITAGLLIALVLATNLFQVIPPSVNNQLIFIIGVFTALIFFFFSLEHKGTVGQVSRVGLVFIMISFGASFGYTVMARISLLIGRFQFLLDEFWMKAILRQG